MIINDRPLSLLDFLVVHEDPSGIWYVLAPHMDLIKLGLPGLLPEPIWTFVFVLIWYVWV